MADRPLVRSGVGVDAYGSQVIDPTENVKALVIAENKRQDDLAELRNILEMERIKRVEDLQKMLADHTLEIARLHQNHDDQMHSSEAQIGKEIANRVSALERVTAEGKGKGEGMGATWAALIGAAGLAGTLIMIGLFVFGGRVAGNTTNDRPVSYSPAPAGTMVPNNQSQSK